jgi:hypothetical protein
MDINNMIGKEGWMRKKGARVNIWAERYFILKGCLLLNMKFFYFIS